MRPRPSRRFWLLVVAGGAAEAAVVILVFLGTQVWGAPIYLLAVTMLPVGLSRQSSLQAMSARRRRGWALVGGVIALAISALVVVLAFLVALGIACENGC